MKYIFLKYIYGFILNIKHIFIYDLPHINHKMIYINLNIYIYTYIYFKSIQGSKKLILPFAPISH